MVATHLAGDGYEIRTAVDGYEALELARATEPDVVVLDIGLPGMDGLEVCRQLRGFSHAYVIMTTARDQEVDRLMGLASGADDYLSKPFSLRELSARIQALLRRPRQMQEGGSTTIRRFGPLVIDKDRREVHLHDEEVALTKIEFEILDRLSAEPNLVHSRDRLVQAVWGSTWDGGHHVVDVHIGNLRKKLDSDEFRAIKTVRGVGFRMNVT